MFNVFKKKNKTKDIINPIDNINIEEYKDLNSKEQELVNKQIEEYKLLLKENNSIIDYDIYNSNVIKRLVKTILNIKDNINISNKNHSIF